MHIHKCNKCLHQCLPYIELREVSHYSWERNIDPDHEMKERKLKEKANLYMGDTCLCYNCSLVLLEWISNPYTDMRISHELGVV